jgi:1,2-diacylglycerol-3-alpha-glucose alpha-1,2-glucosyltransferase
MWAHSTEDDFRDSFTGANAIAPLFRRWIASNYRRGDVVLTPTAYAKDLISTPSYGIEAPIHVLSNGVDTEFFRPDPAAHGALRQELGLPADAHVIMSVGLQMVRKGILEWVSLARRLPEVTFVWYGHTDKGMITREVARAVATAPANCVFPGHVAKDVLRIAYAGADAFLFLTHEETEGIVLLEALASGATTVVSDIPIYRDWLPEGTVTHKVHGHATQKVDEAVQLLGRLFAGELPDLSAAGRAAAEEVDMQRVAERLQQIYVSEGVRAHRV